jgi:hypothetical protein
MMFSMLLAMIVAVPQNQRAQVDTTVTYTTGSTIRVINPAGRIVVRGGDGTTVRIRATFPAGDRLHIDRSGGVQVQRVVAGVPANAQPMTMELDIPRGAPIDLLGQRTDVVVTGMQARILVRTIGGNIAIRGGRGVVQARSVNGAVTVTGADGALDLRSTSERVTVDSSRGDLTVDTRSGDIAVPIDGFRSVKINSLSGHIVLRGAPARESALEASTHSGDVTMNLSTGAKAEIRAETTDGRIDWRVSGAPAASGGQSRFVLGSGGGSVALRSFGGTVRIVARDQ